jgi:tetratricopeptide (TPR) repeat protein
MNTKTLLLTISFLCINFISNGQSQIDSEKGVTFYKSGEFKKALEYFNQISEVDTNCEVLGYKADCYRHIGNYDLAIKFFEQAAKDCQPNYEMYLNLGDSYFKNGRINEAYKFFLLTNSLNSENFEVNYNLGLISYQNKNFDQAKIYDKKAHRLNNNDLDALDLLTEIYNSLSEYDSSLMIIDKLHTERPSNRTILLKAYLYGDMGDYKKCIELTTEVINSDPTNTNAYHNRYLAYYQLNDKRNGCRDYKKLRTLDPKTEIENYFRCK